MDMGAKIEEMLLSAKAKFMGMQLHRTPCSKGPHTWFNALMAVLKFFKYLKKGPHLFI